MELVRCSQFVRSLLQVVEGTKLISALRAPSRPTDPWVESPPLEESTTTWATHEGQPEGRGERKGRLGGTKCVLA